MTPATTPVRIVGRYALHGPIASGGMATVHFGRLIGPVGFSRTVAIKRLHPQFATDPEFVAMFLDEARLAARIRHPNVVPTLDVVATSGELFLVMDYVPGESLSRLVRAVRGQGVVVPPNITVAIMVGVLQGLHAAHEAKNERGAPLGIVHRDVSPQNILVGSDGQARVLDFGVAKAAGNVQTTREGQLKGKLAYMAPEQLRGEACSRQTDIYAASVVLWEALTGQRLFKADNEGAVVGNVLSAVVVAPSLSGSPLMDASTKQIVERIDPIVMRGLARDPAMRFDTAREMAFLLEQAVAPATPAVVSDWVEGIANEVLGARAAQIADIESQSSALPLAQPPTLDANRSDGVSAPGASNISVSANSVARESPSPGRGRAIAIVVGVGALVVVSVAAMTILRPPSPPAGEGAARPASSDNVPSAPPSSATVTSEVAPQASAAPAPAAAPDTGAPAASVPLHAHPSSPTASPPPASPDGTKKTGPARPSCNPPFTFDGAGMKHYKPECF